MCFYVYDYVCVCMCVRIYTVYISNLVSEWDLYACISDIFFKWAKSEDIYKCVLYVQKLMCACMFVFVCVSLCMFVHMRIYLFRHYTYNTFIIVSTHTSIITQVYIT